MDYRVCGERKTAHILRWTVVVIVGALPLMACDKSDSSFGDRTVDESEAAASYRSHYVYSPDELPLDVCYIDNSNGDPQELQQLQEYMQFVRTTLENSWAKFSNVSFVGWSPCVQSDENPERYYSSTPGYGLGSQKGCLRVLFRDSDNPSSLGRPGHCETATNADVVFASRYLNLDDLDRANRFRATVIHEFGHSLSFSHEQNRPVTPDMPEWCQVLRGIGSYGDVHVGPFDIESVMGVGYCSWPRPVLSDIDVQAVRQMHGCDPATTCAAENRDYPWSSELPAPGNFRLRDGYHPDYPNWAGIVLEWDEVPGALEYRIFSRSIYSGSPFAPSYGARTRKAPTNQFFIGYNNLTDCMTYSYSVAAVGSAGISYHLAPNVYFTDYKGPSPMPPACALGPPDLAITDSSMHPESMACRAVTFSAVLENLAAGDLIAPSTRVRLRLDIDDNGSWDLVDEAIVTKPLPVSQSITWPDTAWAATYGTHRLEVCADPAGETYETNTDNNCVTQTLVIDDSVCDLVPPELTIDVPSPINQEEDGSLLIWGTANDAFGIQLPIHIYVYDQARQLYTVFDEPADYDAATGRWTFEVPAGATTANAYAVLWASAQDTSGNWAPMQHLGIEVRPAGVPRADVFDEHFTNGLAPTVEQCNNWNDFRLDLGVAYTELTLAGSYDSAGVSCTDRNIIADIAASLKHERRFEATCDGHTWYVGKCGNGMEVSVDQKICQCGSSYSFRPCIGNYNWGGAGTATCRTQPDQRLRLTFGEPECGGLAYNNACWYVGALGQNCNSVCADKGGFDQQGTRHSGNQLGKYWFPEKASGSNWTTVECSSTDNNSNWGANGQLPNGGFSHRACYLHCACVN